MTFRMALIFLLAAGATAATASEVPVEVAASLGRGIEDLSNVVVRESITRFVADGLRARRVDQFHAVVELADGLEHYSEIRKGGRNFGGADQVEGLWSVGELATVLRVTRDYLCEATEESLDGETVLQFHVSAASHRWFLKVDGKNTWLDFDGRLYRSRATGAITRIEWISAPLNPATGIDRVSWEIRFGRRNVAGRSYTVPEVSLYRITRPGPRIRTEWNVTSFLNYSRYGSEVNISFEEQ